MKRLLLLLVLLALPVQAALAQEYTHEQLLGFIHENLYRTGINTNPYEYLPVAETPVPKGFKPVYISHYGRHGSRSNWGGKHYDHTLDQFTRAHEAGVLTPVGEKAYQDVCTIYRLHNDMNGRLTPRGTREHRAIAQRMYTKYKKVFKAHPRVRAVSSVVPRCIVSMAAFTGELFSQNAKLDISWDTGEQFMKYCSSGDPDDLKKDAYKLILDHAKSMKPDTLYFASRVFKDIDQGRAVVGSIMDFLTGTSNFALIAGSFDLDDSLLRLFTEEDLLYYSQNESLNLFLRQCNSADFGDRRMAVPEVDNLVEDVITKADEVLASGDYAADLRFGHDYQLLAYASRIGIKGVGERLTAQEATMWPGWYYTPFAGNLQMVFYRNKAGEVLVKFYMNERETSLLTLPGGPYYPWEEVKKAFRHAL